MVRGIASTLVCGIASALVRGIASTLVCGIASALVCGIASPLVCGIASPLVCGIASPISCGIADPSWCFTRNLWSFQRIWRKSCVSYKINWRLQGWWSRPPGNGPSGRLRKVERFKRIRGNHLHRDLGFYTFGEVLLMAEIRRSPVDR